MKKLHFTKETLTNLGADEQAQFLQQVNGGMMALPDTSWAACSGICHPSISYKSECSYNACFPTTACSIRGCA